MIVAAAALVTNIGVCGGGDWLVTCRLNHWRAELHLSPTSFPSHVWIPEQEVLVDSSKDSRTELSKFKDPSLVGRDRNLTKSSPELDKQIHL